LVLVWTLETVPSRDEVPTRVHDMLMLIESSGLTEMDVVGSLEMLRLSVMGIDMDVRVSAADLDSLLGDAVAESSSVTETESLSDWLMLMELSGVMETDMDASAVLDFEMDMERSSEMECVPTTPLPPRDSDSLIVCEWLKLMDGLLLTETDMDASAVMDCEMDMEWSSVAAESEMLSVSVAIGVKLVSVRISDLDLLMLIESSAVTETDAVESSEMDFVPTTLLPPRVPVSETVSELRVRVVSPQRMWNPPVPCEPPKTVAASALTLWT
jgi:hypothetical protein